MTRRGRWIRNGLGLLVSAALLWWVFHDVSLAEVWRRVRAADPWLLAGSVVVATLGFVVRALRWRVLLLPAHGPGTSVPFRPRFAAVSIGFMANNVLPARLGEFARAYALSRSSPVGMSAAFASLVVERVFDGLVIAFFLFLSMAVPGLIAADPAGAGTVRSLAVGGAAVFGGALAGLWLVVRYPETCLRVVEAVTGWVLPGEWTERLTRAAAHFIEGLGAVHRPAIFWRAMAWTLFLWLWLAGSIWLGFLAFDITTPGYAGAVFVQSVIGFAVALPSSPGFFGPFEAAARLSLGLFGVEVSQIIGFAVGYHVLTFLPITLLGFWYLHRLGLRWSEVERSEEIVEGGTGTSLTARYGGGEERAAGAGRGDADDPRNPS